MAVLSPIPLDPDNHSKEWVRAVGTQGFGTTKCYQSPGPKNAGMMKQKQALVMMNQHGQWYPTTRNGQQTGRPTG